MNLEELRRLAVERPEDYRARVEALPVEDREALARQWVELWRETCRKDLKFYARNIEVPGTPVPHKPEEFYPEKLSPAGHHDLVLSAIQAMADGRDEADGLMVFMPPGAAKSTYASVVGPSWLLGRERCNLIAVSYADDLIHGFSRRVRSIIRGEDHQNIFMSPLTTENIEEWELGNGSIYKCGGIMSGITGKRANWLFIDDPIRGERDAQSELIRNRIWEAWNQDLDTRLLPGGKVVLIQTRWHEDDLAGRLLGEEWKGQSGLWRGKDGRMWRVINLPMKAEHADDPMGRKPGERLWPEFFTEKFVDRIETKGGRTWSALYQQRPAPNDGAILQRSYFQPWLKTYQPGHDVDPMLVGMPRPPECEFVVLTYDTAFEAGQENDESAMAAFGIFRAPKVDVRFGGRHIEGSQKLYNVILLGAWSGHIHAADLKAKVKEHSDAMEPDLILVEKRASGAQLVQELQRARYPVQAWLPPGKRTEAGKVARAHGCAMVLDSGCLWYIPTKGTERLIEQCVAFPYGQRDDLVDALTMGLIYFREHWMFHVPTDLLTEQEHSEALAQQWEAARAGRRLYSDTSPAKPGLVLGADRVRRLYS
jgi:hypothetical protein